MVHERPFLTAQWRHLALANFEIDPSLLRPLVPVGTELDCWFLFLDTRVNGWSIPYHRNFEEVNLRFYVKRLSDEGWRRAVVFVKEIVPRAAIAMTARWLYGENYVALPMQHRIEDGPGTGTVSYSWWLRGQEQRLDMSVGGEARDVIPDSEQPAQ